MTDEDITRQLKTQLTVSVPVAGRALANLGRCASYEAAKTSSIAGIKVLQIGKKKVVPTAPIRRALGLEEGETLSPPRSR